jgi:RNA polymerase sigma factor (sigma-70 family)
MITPPAPQQLDALAAKAIQGEREAFAQLIVATHLEVRLFVSARVVSAELIEEVVQSTYVTAFEVLNTYVGPGSLLAWLKGIAHNRLRQELRHRSRQQGLECSALETLLQDQRREEDISDDDNRTQRLNECLGKLPPRARLLIERRYVDNHGLARLAQQFKQSTGALAVYLHRVRTDLRRCMTGVGVAP